MILAPLAVMALFAANAAPRAPIKNGTYDDRAEAWSKFTIQGVKLGSQLEKVSGFTCGPPPGTDGFSTQNHSCVKFLDTRCKARPTKIKMVHGGSEVPTGQVCFMDEFVGSTYLDGKNLTPPLSAIRIVGTDTTAPLVFQIIYTLPADDLTSESNLGKALIAKYGPPSHKNEPTAMDWQMDNVRLSARCRATEGPNGEYCELTAEDRALDETEREIQHQANETAKHKNAPRAPDL